MKTKKSLLVVTLCLLVIHTRFAQHTQPPPNVEELYEYLRERAELAGAAPDTPMDFLFFDLNHDGIPEALGSARVDQQGGGLHGNDWELYLFENGEWDMRSYKPIDEETFDTSNVVYARGDDFFSLIREGEKPKLVLIYSHSMNMNGGWRFNDDAWEITIDNDGYLKAIPIPELTTEVFVPDDEFVGDTAPPRKTQKLDYKLVPLPVVTISPSQKGESPSAVQTLRGAYERSMAEATKNASANREAELKMENDQLTIGSKINRLWLYAGILLAICAVFYFVRRKTRN